MDASGEPCKKKQRHDERFMNNMNEAFAGAARSKQKETEHGEVLCSNEKGVSVSDYRTSENSASASSGSRSDTSSNSTIGDTEMQAGEKKTTVRADGKKHVEKGSLVESDLIEAKLQAKMFNKSKGVTTEAEKRDERRAANRLSAFQSRQRRKVVIEGLQKTVGVLSKDNAEQRNEIVRLQQQNVQLQQENRILKDRHSTSSGAITPHHDQSKGNIVLPVARPSQPLSASVAPTLLGSTNTAAAAGVNLTNILNLLQELFKIQGQQALLAQTGGSQAAQPPSLAISLPPAPTYSYSTAATQQIQSPSQTDPGTSNASALAQLQLAFIQNLQQRGSNSSSPPASS